MAPLCVGGEEDEAPYAVLQGKENQALGGRMPQMYFSFFVLEGKWVVTSRVKHVTISYTHTL